MTDPRHDEPELGLPEDDEETARPAPGLDTEGWDELLAVLDRVPFVGVIKRDLQSLSRLVYERRVPRFAFVATPDAGVASLLAALLDATPRTTGDEDGWLRLDADDRHLEVLATPPLGAAEALSKRLPDVLFLVATPAEVDAGLGHHLDAVVRTLAGAEARGERAPAFVPVLVQPPPITGAPARAPFAKQLADAGLHGVEVAAVGLRDGLASVGVDDLAERVAETLPDPARVEGARALSGARRTRRRVATAITRASSTLAVTVAVAPIPLADMALLAPLQGLLVTSIAYLSGRPWDRRTALEWVGSVGAVGAAGLGLRWGAQQAVKAIPGLGSVVSASIAGAGTLAIGRSAVGYFLRE
ncbi:MAG: DUF697 domain-containing protein [Sandaracinus sp.]|nr:DUF697 domain-containing protein [Sandaracinus sp.]